MIPGPYSICRISFPDEDSNAATYETIKYGYDRADDAFAELREVAEEEGLPPDEMVVIKFIDKDRPEEE